MDELYKLISDRCADTVRARLSLSNLYELRIRNGFPVRVGYGGGYYYLCPTGITRDISQAYIADKSEAESIVMRACEHSLYTVTETLKLGYISVPGGIRVGVCGSCVTVGGHISAVKNFSSVNIRLPHEVKGCASSLFGRVVGGDGIKSTLIISRPGGGKTTVLRDLCRLISDRGSNVLLCDEKYELASVIDSRPSLDVGMCTDVMSGADKSSVFKAGIAYMRPDVIMTDELFDADMDAVLRAVHCGIAVVATAHAADLNDLRTRPGFENIAASGAFSRYAVISAPPSRDITVFSGTGEAVL